MKAADLTPNRHYALGGQPRARARVAYLGPAGRGRSTVCAVEQVEGGFVYGDPVEVSNSLITATWSAEQSIRDEHDRFMADHARRYRRAARIEEQRLRAILPHLTGVYMRPYTSHDDRISLSEFIENFHLNRGGASPRTRYHVTMYIEDLEDLASLLRKDPADA